MAGGIIFLNAASNRKYEFIDPDESLKQHSHCKARKIKAIQVLFIQELLDLVYQLKL